MWGTKVATEPSINTRLCDRDDQFGQSFGRFRIQRKIQRKIWFKFYLADWFHSLINTRWPRIVVVVVLVYLIFFTTFAALYSVAGDHCFADGAPQPAEEGQTVYSERTRRFLRAFFFSVETMMTIGYSAQDPGFSECFGMLTLITMQALCGVLAQSLLMGVVLTRVSRADQRACTVAFSSVAIVRAAYDEL